MSYSLKTLISDEFHYESVNKTSIKYSAPLQDKSAISTITVGHPKLIRAKSFRDIENQGGSVINIKIETSDRNNGFYESTRNKLSLPQSKSFSQISNINRQPVKVSNGSNRGSLTYHYNCEDNNRHVTFVKHTDNDSGLSLPGCLVKASHTFLPVNRSLELGAIFNGNAFGLLTEHLQIKDVFDLSFDFKTNARNGILMIIVDSRTNDSFFIELYDSQLKATLLIDDEPDSCWTDFSRSYLSNDVWVNVNVKVVGSRMTMTVKNDLFTKNHRRQMRFPIRGDLFVAGHPSTIRPPFACRSKDFFVGEMRNFFVNNDGIKWYGTPADLDIRLRNWY